MKLGLRSGHPFQHCTDLDKDSSSLVQEKLYFKLQNMFFLVYFGFTGMLGSHWEPQPKQKRKPPVILQSLPFNICFIRHITILLGEQFYPPMFSFVLQGDLLSSHQV